MTRYFICFYYAFSPTHDEIRGSRIAKTENQKYVNRNAVQQQVKDDNNDIKNLGVVLTNIIEINEEEFNEFVR